jgi:carboxymethylenebutenolidase
MALQEEKVRIWTPDGPMDTFIVQPEKPAAGKIQAVVVIQEAYGVNRQIQEVCRRTAQEGFIAIAPELFHREGHGLEFDYDFSKVLPVFSKLNNEGIATDIGASLPFLKQRFGISSDQCAVMGFCVGGLATMISAIAHPIGTAVSYYGGGMVERRAGMALSPIIGDFEKIQCPVLLIFGEEDQSIPLEQVRKVEDALQAAHRKYELVIYPKVGHAFSNDDRPSFNVEATRAAWAKTLSWLRSIR